MTTHGDMATYQTCKDGHDKSFIAVHTAQVGFLKTLVTAVLKHALLLNSRAHLDL